MSKQILRTILVAAFAGSVLMAQQATPKPSNEAAQQKPRPTQPTETPTQARSEPAGQPVNIRIQLTITDQFGSVEPSKKVVTLIAADRQSGIIRSRGFIQSKGDPLREVVINVDARPLLLKHDVMRLDLSFEYQPRTDDAAPTSAVPSSLHQRISVVLQSGQPLTISQAIDPASGRQTSVDVTATVLK